MIDNKIKEKLNKVTQELFDLEMDIAKDFRDKADMPEISMHGELFNFVSIAIRHLQCAQYRLEHEKEKT